MTSVEAREGAGRAREGRAVNLLKETKRVMSWSGYTIDDIAWVGCDSFRIPTEVFIERADTEYDDWFGAPEVAQDLVIVLRDGSWMERAEYDGSERWSLKRTPRMPDDVWDGAVALTVRQVDGASCGWENLGKLCALAERGRVMAGIKTLGFAVEDHDPRSWELYRFIADMDYENGDTFCFKAGGDGDNGELILAYLDEWFALAERGER